MKLLSMIGGVGSMVIGAKEQGWEIIGNVEWRKYYHSGTWEANFPGTFMVENLDQIPDQTDLTDLDLIIGHTECGIYSRMRVHKSSINDDNKYGDIPIFLDSINKLKPKFFAMDNLPTSLNIADWKYYAENVPDYEIHFEWVSNYGYGNIQKYRNRLFVIGARKDQNFVFIPSEFKHSDTYLDRLDDIDPEAPNNEPLEEDSIYGGWARYMFDKEYIPKSVEENRLTLRQFKEFIKDVPVGPNFPYYNKSGEQKRKIGFSKVNIDNTAAVLSGGGACFDNHFRSDTLNPFTIRERAKIQGCPDDFVFKPENVTKTGPDYGKLIKQTGKFMPVEFCTHLTGLIKDHLEGNLDPEKYTWDRVIKPNALVDRNKIDFCRNIGYSAGFDACKFCGSKEQCDKELRDENKE